VTQPSPDIWTIKRAHEWTRNYLEQKGDEQARLSTEWLLSHACGLERIEVYTQFDKPLSPVERDRLREGVRRRAEGEPLQYIVGEVGFRHLTLEVRPDVLIPRPETEILVELALDRLPAPVEDVQLQVLDLCTGSGCVGLSIAHERLDTRVIATDISPAAVNLANVNAADTSLADRFHSFRGDLFEFSAGNESETECVGDSAHSAGRGAGSEPILRRGRAEHPFAQSSVRGRDEHPHFYSNAYDLIVSNPPYIPSGAGGMDALPTEVADHEPHLALDGGGDGLDIARRIIEQAPAFMKKSTYLILELDERNVHAAAEFAVQLNTYDVVEVERDLTGRERFVLARRRL